MNKINQNLIIENIIILLISFSYFIYSSLFRINYYFAIFVAILLIFLSLSIISQKRSIFELDIYQQQYFKLIFIPNLILILYSFIIIFFNDNYGISNYMKYISRVLLFLMTSLQAIALVTVYKKKAINIIYKSAVINYLVYIIVFIKQHGFLNLFYYPYLNIMGDFTLKTVLEAHEITFVFGVLFLYFFFNNKDNKLYKKRALICLIFCILGFKRILTASILVTIFIYYILKNCKNNKKIVLILSTLIIFICYLWVYFVKIDVLEVLSIKYDINFMGRLNFYSLLSNHYDFNALFLGNGLGFAEVFGNIYSKEMNNYSLHSSVLLMFVENGFIVFGLYMFNYIYLNAVRIGKYSKDDNKLLQYFLISMTVIICWFTDNLATYYNFLVAINVIFLTLSNCILKEGEYDEEDNKKIA